MLGRLRYALLVGAMLLSCGRYQRIPAYQIDRRSDPVLASEAVQQTLAAHGYRATEPPRPGRATRVIAHTGEGRSSESWINIAVGEDGRIALTPSGGLVKGSTLHRRFAREIEALRQQIGVRVSVLTRQTAAPVSAIPTTAGPERERGAPTPAPPQEPTPAAPLVPRAWNERAPGRSGEFTCIPARLRTSADQLKLRLSDGRHADLTLSVAYPPTVCRSPSSCRLPEGCPALGLGNPAQVAQLARRLSDGAIGSEAILVQDDQPVASLDLRRHGSVQQALNQLGAPKARARPNAPGSP